MGHDNDYSVTAFFPSGEPKKWGHVHKLNTIVRYLDKTYPDWKYMNVYDRRNGNYLKRFYKGNFIPEFLSTNSMS
jgi:hypothetical protein